MNKKWKLYIVTLIVLLIFLFFGKTADKREDKEDENKKDEVFSSVETPEIVYDSVAFKMACEEIIYNDIDESYIGKYVTKELVAFEHKEPEDGCRVYTGAALEDFIEDLDAFQNTYRVYKLRDYRLWDDYDMQSEDIMRVYGIVEDITYNQKNGKNVPIIRMYYADYIRQYGEKPEQAKNLEEIEEERKAEEEEYAKKDAINSDYTGVTKNIEGMSELPLEDYIQYCDSMCMYDIVSSKYALTGRHVKIHVKTSYGERFTGDEAKRKYLGQWESPENIHDNVWNCVLYNERSESYVLPTSRYVFLYFKNTEDMDVLSLKKGTEIIAYGQIVKHNVDDDRLEVLVRYYE
ncbi:MAG: hypothetical protein IKT67_02120 [Lachnospiraceae bacterium]|nr:hypothetical protein [Lachnospiraceae bacterium]